MAQINKDEVRKFINALELWDDYILIKPIIEGEKETDSGIIIPGQPQKNRADRAVVLKISDYVETVIPGDKIIFHKYAVVEVGVDLEKLYILSLKDVIGVYERRKKTEKDTGDAKRDSIESLADFPASGTSAG